MALIYAGALAAGWAMLPGDNERVAMLERDGHSREALSILEQQYANGDRRYRTVHQMQSLYEDEGDVARAGALLALMTHERPRDAGLKRRLAQFYRNTQNESGYLAALQAQIDLRYSEGACRELVARLRLKGDFRAEQTALQTCRQKGYRRPDDLLRLASLAAASGDTAQAATLLRSIDDLKRLKSSHERYQLLTLLLDQDQPREAERRSLRWIRSAKDDTQFAVGLIDLLARSKYPASAMEVAKDAGVPGDSISLTIAERLIEQAQLEPARLYLRGWLERAGLEDRETALRFTEAALATDDPETAFRGARKSGLERLPGPTLRRLTAALEGAEMTGDAEEVRLALRATGVESTSPSETVAPAVGELPQKDALQPGAPASAVKRTEPRRIRLPDVLENWRRSLATRMSDDALRRLQALTVGPPAPSGGHVGRHQRRGFSFGVSGEARPELRPGSAKFLKKTARVLQRAKKNRLLKANRRPLKEQVKKAAPAGGPAVAKPQPSPQP